MKSKTICNRLDGHWGSVKEADYFTYLGSIFVISGETGTDVKDETTKARTAFSLLSTIWASENIKTGTKFRLFNANVKTVPLYSLETWMMTKTTTTEDTNVREILPEMASQHQMAGQDHERGAMGKIRRRACEPINYVKKMEADCHILRKLNTSITNHSLTWRHQGNQRSS